MPAAIPTDRLGWRQDGPSLLLVQTYTAEAAFDGQLPQPLLDLKWSGTATPYTCTARLPTLAAGQHTVVVRVTETLDGVPLTSEWSLPLAFVMRGTPGKPTDVQIVRNGTATR